MTMTSLEGTAEWPYLSIQGTTAPGFSNMAIDADNEAIAFVFPAPKTGNISKAGFRTAVVTTGGDLDLALQTVDGTSGDPTGTNFGTNTNVTITVAGSDDNVWKEGTFTAAGAVTQGQLLAIVLRRISGTFAGNIAVVSQASTGWLPRFAGVSYQTQNQSGTWTKTNQGCGPFGIQYDDGVCYQIYDLIPATAFSSITFNNGSSPDEYGDRFQVPTPRRAYGAAAPLDADGDFQFVLYDDSGTQLAITNTILATQRSLVSHNRHYGIFTSSVDLATGTWYRLCIKPVTATSIVIRHISVAAAAWLGNLGGGTNYYECSRTDAGAFTDTPTDRVMLSLIYDGADNGAGAGTVISPEDNVFDTLIVAGTTSKILEIMVRDSTTGGGKTGLAFGSVTASYIREGGTRTAITLASGTAGDAYSSGKWAEVDATNSKGVYQLHVPNAAIAAGVAAVTITLQASGMTDRSVRIALPTVNAFDAVRFGITALPNANAAASGGLLTFGSGSGQLNPSSGKIPATIAAGDLANDSITAAVLAASAGAELQALITGGAYPLNTDSGGSIRIVDGTGPGEIDTTSGAVLVDKTGYRLSATGVDDIWDEVLAAHTTSDTPGLVLNMLTQDSVTLSTDVNINSIFGQIMDAGTSWTYDRTTDSMEQLANVNAATIADAVWDEVLSGHLTAGTTGAALNAAGSAGDPWSTALPGAYGAGTAGKIIGDNIDATISSRGTNAGVWSNGTRNLTALGFALAASDFGTDWLTASGLAASAGAELQALITGGAYPLSTDANGRIRIVDGTGTGELDTASGLVSLAASQSFSTSGSVGSVAGNVTGSIGSLAVQAKADVNAEVLDVMATDTYTIPGTGTPTATPTLAEILRWNYKEQTNKRDQDTNTGLQQIYSRAGVVEQKRTVTDASGLTTVNALVAA